ncbi:VanZ family protein [Paenibacillus hexagrammi]|uniref:VanZ family protein n=1 Tax=Paenibacillus hexagrammi TaxID=2908839 RepID=A0ABY3SCD4_9BACL|nr:VanZ family protein [Paenibacillus sp. YPD9-1]UJF31672.1 VanZ family protein [Paenibacillus sp. YPD9-1]
MNKKYAFRFYILLAATLLWMAVIFMKSAETYQQQSLRPLLSQWFQGSGFLGSLPHWEFVYDQDTVTWQDPIGLIEFFIRKAGHVTEYGILALLCSLTLLAKPVRASKALVTSCLISVLYAASDEWHQTFVPQRTGHAIDIAIDSIGILSALLLVALIVWIKRRKRG